MIIPDPIAQSRNKLGLGNLHKLDGLKEVHNDYIPDPIAQSRDKLGLGILHKMNGLKEVHNNYTRSNSTVQGHVRSR